MSLLKKIIKKKKGKQPTKKKKRKKEKEKKRQSHKFIKIEKSCPIRKGEKKKNVQLNPKRRKKNGEQCTGCKCITIRKKKKKKRSS